MLMVRLEAMVFNAMQDSKDPLYSNELAKLIKDSKKARQVLVGRLRYLAGGK